MLIKTALLLARGLCVVALVERACKLSTICTEGADVRFGALPTGLGRFCIGVPEIAMVYGRHSEVWGKRPDMG